MTRATGDALRMLFGVILGLALAELGVRLWLEWLPQPRTGTYVRDARIGYRLRPEPARGDTLGNPYHVNALGFRDREHAPVKPEGVRRVLGIGDSFVAGEVRLEDNFLRVAERSWNRPDPGRSPSRTDSVEVILMGLGGYGPEQYLGVLGSVGLAVDPDLVVLCFYTGNDVTGISTRHEVWRGELYSTSSSDPRLDLLRKSRLFAWLEKRIAFRMRRDRLREYRAAERTGPTAGITGETPAEPPLRPAVPVELTRAYLAVLRNRLPFYAESPPPRVERLWTEALGSLDRFDRVCRDAGIPWALAILPDEFQVDPDVRAEACRRLGAQPAELDLYGPSRRLRLWASTRGVPALDLLPLFREEHERRGPLYIPNDTHWNEDGNRLAGEAIARFAERLPGWRAQLAGARSRPDPNPTGGEVR